MTTAQAGQIGLNTCELEPIRFPGAVQPHGALLVLQPVTGIIEAASASCQAVLGRTAESLLGQPLGTILDMAATADLLTAQTDDMHQVVHVRVGDKEMPIRVGFNESGQVLLEIEPPEQATFLTRRTIYRCRHDLSQLRQMSDVAAIAQEAATMIRGIAGYDRVMIYRFDAEWNGEVIAEARIDSAEPYLGLNFPASDIPKQARELFQACKVRIIPDIHYAPSDLIARGDSRAIDLGLAGLRSVSPIHIEYCKNMDIRASLVGALVVAGRLWGLVACHHFSGTKYFGPDEREALGWLFEDIAALIGTTLTSQLRSREQFLAIRRRKLLDVIREVDIKALLRQGQAADLLDVVGADGFALLVDDAIHTVGNTPKPERIRQLQAQRRQRQIDPTLFATNALTRDLDLGDVGDGVAGALFVSVLDMPNVTMIWFRNERRSTVHWAGDPNHPHQVDKEGRIWPRTSFAQFLHNVEGQSLPWQPEEIHSASDMGALIEIEALHEAKYHYQLLADGVRTLIWKSGLDKLCNYFNEPWLRFTGRTLEQEMGNGWVEGVHPDDRDRCLQIYVSAFDRREPFSMDYRLHHADGTYHWISDDGTPTYDSQGEFLGYIGACSDITVRKKAEDQVREAERRLESALKWSQTGAWDLDLVDHSAFRSLQHDRIFGYESLLPQWTFETFLEHVVPEDRAEVNRTFGQAIADNTDWSFECRIRRVDDEVRWIWAAGGLHRKDGGAPRMTGIVRDITKQKRAEAQLRESQERYSALFNEARAVMLLVEPTTGAILEGNHAAQQFYGYGIEEIQGMKIADINTQSPDEVHAEMERAKAEQRDHFIFSHRLASGEVRDVEVHSGPFHYHDKTVLYSIVHDITARKQAEAKVDELLREQDAILASDIVGMVRLKDRTFTWANKACARMLGYTVEELIDQPSRMVYLSDQAYAEFAELAYPVIERGEVFRTEMQYRRKDGTLGCYDVSGGLIFPGHPESIWSFLDITASKLAEAELDGYRHHLEDLVADRTTALSLAKEAAEAAMNQALQAHHQIVLSKATQAAALASMGDAVFISDTEGRFIDFNDAFAIFHRFKNKDECAKTLAEYPVFLDVYLSNGELVPLEQWAVSRALRGESANNVEFTLLRKDTGETWVGSYSYAPIRGKDGVIIGSVVTARDITERKKFELALVQAKDAAEGANRAKTVFLATMSHELRTPLNAIMGMTELALRRVTDPKQGEQLNKAKAGANNLLGIIKDILDISRIEADRLQLQEAKFSLDHVLDTVTNSFGAKAADKNLELVIDIDPELAVQSMRGDRLRLGQVLLNLTGNAIKFTAQGSVALRVLMVDDNPNSISLRFEVQDSGIGIAVEDQRRIFEVFEQADGSSTRKFGGTGLGLTICKRLVQLMGGEIHVDSKVGVGSTFWFVVRLEKVGELLPALPVLAALTARRQLKERHDGAYILVAEDDPLNREVVQGLLEEAGLIVQLAEDGATAVAMAKRTIYDLILMDLQMPVMDGLEATRLIRKSSHNPDVPIIALTANVFPEDEARCRDAGMNDFIGRPVESEVLFKALLRWLDRRLN
jgi:PAS domain S-box-containing protein